MKRYKIKEAFALKSAGNKLMHIGGYYATEDEAQIAELEKFLADGSVEAIESQNSEKAGLKLTTNKKEKKVETKPDEPTEDITVVPGIGKTLAEKLAELEVTTVSKLKERLNEEDVKAVLGLQFERVSKYFDAE